MAVATAREIQASALPHMQVLDVCALFEEMPAWVKGSPDAKRSLHAGSGDGTGVPIAGVVVERKSRSAALHHCHLVGSELDRFLADRYSLLRFSAGVIVSADVRNACGHDPATWIDF